MPKRGQSYPQQLLTKFIAMESISLMNCRSSRVKQWVKQSPGCCSRCTRSIARQWPASWVERTSSLASSPRWLFSPTRPIAITRGPSCRCCSLSSSPSWQTSPKKPAYRHWRFASFGSSSGRNPARFVCLFSNINEPFFFIRKESVFAPKIYLQFRFLSIRQTLPFARIRGRISGGNDMTFQFVFAKYNISLSLCVQSCKNARWILMAFSCLILFIDIFPSITLVYFTWHERALEGNLIGAYLWQSAAANHLRYCLLSTQARIGRPRYSHYYRIRVIIPLHCRQ